VLAVAFLDESAADEGFSVSGSVASNSPSQESTRRFSFSKRTSSAASVYSGATTTSLNESMICSAVSASHSRLSATMPPKALIGSVERAFS